MKGSTPLWWLAAAAVVGLGWLAGSQSLAPVTVPGPTATATYRVTVPEVVPQTVPPGWRADPASPHPAGIPEGRHLVVDLVAGNYLGIPANAHQPCEWRREGYPDSVGHRSINEQGSGSEPVRVTIRQTDTAFVSHGCQWKLLPSR